ncbi:MAG: L-glyceraldehyde 3-phosphate reductase, partial [Mycobacterium sp.]|nr:L-glyceraldehyde 3-phosphate reductase [Mycobacterium sp.]
MTDQFPHYPRVHLAAENRYDTLPFRRAGVSGLDLPAFSFGLWQKFGADYAFDTQRDI